MRISFSPQRRDDTLEVTKQGDVLTINGESFDFSSVPEGATLPASAIDSDFISGDVTRVDGKLAVTLLLPHGPNPSHEVAFPVAIEEAQDGVIALPHDEVEDDE